MQNAGVLVMLARELSQRLEREDQLPSRPRCSRSRSMLIGSLDRRAPCSLRPLTGPCHSGHSTSDSCSRDRHRVADAFAAAVVARAAAAAAAAFAGRRHHRRLPLSLWPAAVDAAALAALVHACAHAR